ncbi:MAG: hypothetical protein AAFQ22_03135 [Pseudomonadota bacterium]
MHVLVVGAGRPLGAQIALNLLKAGHRVTATRHQRRNFDAVLEAAGAELASLNLRDLEAVDALAPGLDAAILVPILSLSGPAAQRLGEKGLSRGVVFSSNNLSVAPEAPVYQELAKAEAALLETAPDWAVLRPTMIYGHLGSDALAGLMRRVASAKFLPIPGSGRALQQPLHIDDLTRLSCALVTGEWRGRGVLPVGGPDVLSQADLLRAVCEALGRTPIIMRLPASPARLVARLAHGLGVKLPLDQHQLARIDRDKHVQEPAGIPEAFLPTTDLGDALRDMARRLNLIPPDR